MECRTLTALGILLLIHRSLQSTDDGIPANMTVLIADVELNEKEDARTMLGGGPVVTCFEDDGDQVRAYIQTVSPSAGCGTRCLQLEPCGDDFCLWFLANSALSFSTVSVYTVTVGCTDDVEAAVTVDLSVTIVSNSPPTFTPDNPPYASVNVHGQKTDHDSRHLLYKVETDDIDGDPVYYTMSTDPITEFIEIEYVTGQMKAAQDLRMLCDPLVEASVYARDPYSVAMGPFVVDVNIDNVNERPTITNLDTTVTIEENLAVDKRVLEFDVVDGKLTDHNYNQRSATSAGMESYGMRAPSLRTLISLNYEREDTRSVKLYFDVDDGYCRSETYSLTVNVVDVPEAPEYTHTAMIIMTDEGHINEPNNVFILDEDLNEVHTHAEESGTDDLFDVEPTTGNIISVQYLQLVPGRQYKDYQVRMRATDKDGLTTSRYQAKVRVFDINDRRPYFTNYRQPFIVSAHECLGPGSVLGRVKGTDDDSDYNQNNWVYFGGGGGNFDIAANGWVVLNQKCINGETYTGTATISDQGIKPGPLTGDPMGVIVNCGPCPTETVTTTPAATTAAPTNGTATAASTGGQGGGGSSIDDLLPWAIPALVGVLTWLALTTFLAYRFCRSCTNPCSGCRNHRPPTPIQVSPEPSKSSPPPKGPPPPPKPKTPTLPPVPPPPPATIPDPYLFSFWKETYTDQDQKHRGAGSKPTAIENMPVGEAYAPPPEHLRLGPPGADANLPRFLAGNSPRAVSPAQVTIAQPKPKSKWCTIL